MGSQPNFIPKRIINRRASQKVGMAKPMKTNTVVALSNREYCLTAETMPMGRATMMMKSRDKTFMVMVMGSLSKIFRLTKRLSRKDLPISNLTSLLSQSRYWMGRGLSNP